MKTGERHRFNGVIKKMENIKHRNKAAALLIDLTDEQGRSITDYVWIDLPTPLDLTCVNLPARLTFEARIKKFQTNSYYDYHERERVQLRPILELSEISEIAIKP